MAHFKAYLNAMTVGISNKHAVNMKIVTRTLYQKFQMNNRKHCNFLPPFFLLFLAEPAFLILNLRFASGITDMT